MIIKKKNNSPQSESRNDLSAAKDDTLDFFIWFFFST